MRKFFLLTVLCIITISTWAVPARKGGIVVTQPDGSKITIHQHGDESFHWITNEKGEWLKQDADGFYQVIDSMSVKKIQSRRKASTIQPQQRVGKPNIAPRGLIILVNYQDVQFSTADKAEMDSMLNGENYSRDYSYTHWGYKYNVQSTGSARKYFYDASYGQYNPQFNVVGPVTVSKNMAYYGENNSYGDDKNAKLMVAEACELVDDSVDFSLYDNDNNGAVDFVYVIYAGYGEADGGDAHTIWPHSSSVSYQKDLKLDGKKINIYACSNEINYISKVHDGIGTFCHEFSHVLGLPDLYATNDAEHKTLGSWDIMGNGSYNNNGNTPPTYSAYERFFMGWLTPRILVDSENVVLQDLQETNTAFLISETDEHNLVSNNPNPTTFYLLENRQQKGWDEYLPWHGMMLTKIQYNATKWNNNTVNNIASAMGVDLIEADGKNSGNYGAKPGDIFPAGAIEYFGIENHPIKHIKQKNGIITFSYKDATPIPTPEDKFDELCLIHYTSDYGLDIDSNAFDANLIGMDIIACQSVLIFDQPVTTIDYGAFNNSSLTSITIPNSVTSIGNGAFRSTDLVSITIPNSVTSIGDSAFFYCDDLTSITIPNSITRIGNSVFEYCLLLPSITIPNSVTNIGERAFEYCHSLTSIAFPDSVTTIGQSAFGGCRSLKSITIGKSVTSIGASMFWGCSSLSTVLWNARRCPDLTNSPFSGTGISIKTIVFGDSVEYIPARLCNYINSLTSITIPNSVKSIGEYAFAGCDSLKSVTIDKGVTDIGKSAFAYCGLHSITIPNSVTSIGEHAFYDCDSLKSLTIGDRITNIGDQVFTDCDALRSIFIPNSVKSIGMNAFAFCNSLDTITIGTNVSSLYSAFHACENLSTIFWNAKRCGDLFFTPFEHCYKINTFVFGDSVEYIPARLCDNINSLTSITIPSSVKSIGDSAFHSCKALETVTIGDSVTIIGEEAFHYCRNLASITIPYNITTIGELAFASCDSLKSVIWNAKQCADFATDNPFRGSHALKNFVFGDSVEHIPARLCYQGAPTSITIPASVKSIGTRAFYNHTNLEHITCKAGTPPNVGEKCFDYLYSDIMLHVPCGTTSVYQEADGWNVFRNIQEEPYESIYSLEVIVDEECGTVTIENTCDEIQIHVNSVSGCEFSQWSDGNTDNPRMIVLTQDTVLTAEFATKLYTISTKSSNLERGETAGDTTVHYLEHVTITATPYYGYYFVEWSDHNTENPRVVKVTEDKTYTASFQPKNYSVTKLCDSQQGVIEGVTSAQYLSRVWLKAIPNEGYRFVRWSNGALGQTLSFVITQDTTFTAEFEFGKTCTVFVEKIGQGMVLGAGTHNYGDQVTLKAIPADSYRFAKWSDGVVDNPRSFVITQDTTFTVEFVTNTCEVIINENEYGSTTGAGVYNYGDEVTLVATPYDGYYFVKWSNGITDNPYIFLITDNVTLSAEFDKTSSVENTDSKSQQSDTHKLLRDGQLIIVRDGVEYNAMGQEM